MTENTNPTTNTCPCCPRHCDLSAPNCDRGREYLRTGVIPERKGDHHPGGQDGHHHGEHHHHGGYHHGHHHDAPKPEGTPTEAKEQE